MSSAHAISFNRISAGYGKHTVLEDVSLEVDAGERIAVTGANGSGKSTLLKLISGTLVPFSGSIEVLGARLTDSASRQRIRQRIGFLTQIQQDPEIAVSVEESVLLGLWGSRFAWLRRPDKKDRRRVLERLATVGMDHLSHRDIRTLSGGQRQRVALARALIRDPELIMMDEPTTYLDADAKEDLLQRVQELHRIMRFTLLIVSHEPLSTANADRILHLASGHFTEKEQTG